MRSRGICTPLAISLDRSPFEDKLIPLSRYANLSHFTMVRLNAALVEQFGARPLSLPQITVRLFNTCAA
jgi:hypothetical protein